MGDAVGQERRPYDIGHPERDHIRRAHRSGDLHASPSPAGALTKGVVLLFIRMAWRNIGRNPRRSLITIATISLGLAVLILVKGLGDGFHEQMIENSIRIYT